MAIAVLVAIQASMAPLVSVDTQGSVVILASQATAVVLVLVSAQMAWVPTVEGSLPQLPESGAEMNENFIADCF